MEQMCEVFQMLTTQIFLQQLHFTALDAGYYIAPTTAICSLLIAFFLEFPKLHELIDSGEVSNVHEIPPLLVLSGIIGVAVNFSSYFVIQYISSLMAKLVVVARSAALVIFFIVFQGEAFTAWELVGYSISLAGFAGYSWLKAREKGEVKNEETADVELTRSPRDGEDESEAGSTSKLLTGQNKVSPGE